MERILLWLSYALELVQVGWISVKPLIKRFIAKSAIRPRKLSDARIFENSKVYEAKVLGVSFNFLEGAHKQRDYSHFGK